MKNMCKLIGECPLMTVWAVATTLATRTENTVPIYKRVALQDLPKTKTAKSCYSAMICCDLVAQTVIRGHAHMS